MLVNLDGDGGTGNGSADNKVAIAESTFVENNL